MASEPSVTGEYTYSSWIGGIYDHPVTNSFVVSNLKEPSYIQPASEDSILVLLLKGINRISGMNTLWSVLIYPDKNVQINQIFFNSTQAPYSYAQVLQKWSAKQTLEIKFTANLDSLFYCWTDPSENKADAVSDLNEMKQINVGKPMPDFTVLSLAGIPYQYNGKEKKIVVINLWATWCKPCLKEIPGLHKLAEKYSMEEDVRFVAIALDDETKVSRFLEKQEFGYEQYILLPESAELFGKSVPRNIIIDSEGVVRFDKVGGSENTYEWIEMATEKLLAGKK